MKVLEEHKIYLDKPKKSEEIPIKYPLYQNCYASALEALWVNFQHSEDAKAQNTPQGLISNIIAFMGVRGSGKTTALCEFNKILKDYEKYRTKCESVLFHKKQTQEHRGWFHVLQNIDASLLEKDEDIIELIWANMYKDFRKVNERERRQDHSGYQDELANKIVKEFDDVYKDYKQPRENRTTLGDTVLAKLKHLSSSLKTKESCDELIGDFLKYMQSKTEEKEDNAFLVVTVDDLDLNMGSGYRILEDLYRYLNNPRVIVLIAVDLTQMKAISDKYFIDMLYTEKNSETFSNIGQAERLSSDFLVKVLPLTNRVYLPDKKNILRKAVVVSADRIGDIKQFILGKIAEKMGIYYDATGLKQHFCVPQTQRELVQYNDFLKMLYDTDDTVGSEETRMQLYDANHERFNRDISENMVPRVLNLEQQEIFRLILERNIDRRAEYAVNFLNNRRQASVEQEKQQKLSDSVDDRKYYYSDLLEAINKLGRTNYGDKALVHCVLASFTSEMTREYYSYVNNPDEEARQRAAKRLESFLGNTVGGAWFRDIGPRVEGVDDNSIWFNLHCADQGDISQFVYTTRIEMKNNSDIICIEDISYLVPILECVFLLFPNCFNEDGHKVKPEWKIKIITGSDENNDVYRIEVQADNKQADFDVFGFVGKEIRIDDISKNKEQTDKIIESLVSNLSNIWKKKKRRVNKNNEKKWRKHLESKSIWNGEEERKVYFPFYNLDMAYNVMKRVRRKIKEVTTTIKGNEILQYFQEIYGYIALELQKEDDYYKEIDDFIQKEWSDSSFKKVASNFEDDFVNSPYIKAIGYRYWDVANEKWIEKKAQIDETSFNKLMYEALNNFAKNIDDPMNSLASM